METIMGTIIVLMIISIGLLVALLFGNSTLSKLCTSIKTKMITLSDKIDTQDTVLRHKCREAKKYEHEIEKIVFSNEESQVKVRKLIELSQKRNNP
ncbi:MAG: hypothetical protein HFJ52_00305 [Clostridia bacterium]|jgi:hypothetical protein|nr:hypothetical protein [Clostridia bacterium]